MSGESPEGYWKNKADGLANHVALLTLSEEEQVSVVITQVQAKEPNLTLALATLQEGAEEIQNLRDLGQDKREKYIIFEHEEVICAQHKENKEWKWVIPKTVRMDLIQFALEEHHLGYKNTLNKIKEMAW